MKPKICSECPYKKKCPFELSKGGKVIFKSFTVCPYYKKFIEEKKRD